MIIVVAPGCPVSIVEPSNMMQFHVEARSGTTAAEAIAALRLLGATASDDGAHVFVPETRVREWAADAATPEWSEEFADMVAYAASKGWVDEAGRIRAHIVMA